jgi:hypothetical protein
MRAQTVIATSAASTAEVERLRSDRGLRLIHASEEGFNVYDLPGGVYGFTYAPGLREVPMYAKRPYHSFEIQRLASGEIHTLGFVTAQEQAAMNGKEAAQAMLYPDPWNESTVLVSLPDTRLQPARKAVSREEGNPFKTLVFPL